MKATKEMIELFSRNASNYERGIQAVLDLIDPVPAHVREISDRRGDRWWRSEGDDEHWECNLFLAPRHIRTIMTKFAPITWEGKP